MSTIVKTTKLPAAAVNGIKRPPVDSALASTCVLITAHFSGYLKMLQADGLIKIGARAKTFKVIEPMSTQDAALAETQCSDDEEVGCKLTTSPA